ncbi:MAG: hypothetical protein E8A46_10110 [Bradyrhizobium sp.]|jgi:hypothetical protein|uniref:hypothetical protein n=1 Tax=Bradyrhizobium sp. TaxID=376 RepID=UPI001200696C|nr:hypothetical protein [Bradyrhizobium sp.]THD53730.1 MAG: hypothetical protein E8A46_10110 [Bradyrhizobium sp.]
MTRTELAMGTATFVAVIAAGWLSVASVDRHYAADETFADRHDAQPPSASSAACVGADGSWKNWVWANVPMLSPKCGDR